ncbi:hypothetical protein N0V82_007191 [Gnomoniopsis sp. IMI 355080]|nr:hypothetical protein N0V82_007191 [Gnomoniopsis sp. IMI 355080]
MPPRKRKRPSEQPEPSSPNVDVSNTTLSSSLSLDDTLDAPPFLNTTFTTHRASPLHLGAEPLNQPRLNTLSQRLRDLLVGDVVRGIELGLDRDADPAMRRAGALELVSFGWVRLESLLGPYVGDGDGDEADTSASTVAEGLGGSSRGKRRALQIALQYENTECVALLLPALGHGLEEGSSENENQAGFLHLPLLLLRMPPPLRTVICGFLSRTFDCRISSLGLGTRSLVGALERWLGESRVLGGLVKDVVVTLGFYGPTVTAHQTKQTEAAAKADQSTPEDEGKGEGTRAVGIKSIDIIIPHAELRRFVRAGRAYESAALSKEGEEDTYDARKRRHLAGDKDEEGWTLRRWRRRQSPSSSSAEDMPPHQQQQQPFIEALAQYVRAHLALDLFHPAVRVVKVACGGFVISEGRVKIFGVPPSSSSREGEEDGNGVGLVENRAQRAVWAVYEGLGERARVMPVEKTLGIVAKGWEG